MKRRSALIVASSALTLATAGASAQSLPAIKTDGANKIPECATPGRLMAFVFGRNQKIDPRFAVVATSYMRHGEELSIRWDYAFFQMILETGNLGYMRGNNKPGDVKPSQNNFAGLGATGKGEPGEAFATIDDGVKAHLQHLQMYAGERVESPVAERTRKVQEWGVLGAWQKGFTRPITFADLAAKWAPGSKSYGSDIKSIAGNFYDDMCNRPDPRPELVHEARAGRGPATDVARQDAGKGTELARQAIERARTDGDGGRSTLGAKAVGTAKPTGRTAAAATSGTPAVTVLNESTDDPSIAVEAASAAQQPAVQLASAAVAAKAPPAKDQIAAAPAAKIAAVAALPKTVSPPPAKDQTAAAPAAKVAAAAALPKTVPPPPASQAAKCRVWTASYGGQKSVIIRATGDQFTNFTVLDVNEGQEAREVDAYIAAYAKGGQKVGEFPNQNTALDKAFQLCPEG